MGLQMDFSEAYCLLLMSKGSDVHSARCAPYVLLRQSFAHAFMFLLHVFGLVLTQGLSRARTLKCDDAQEDH